MLLSTAREPVDAFFDKVMVMVEDERVRANRLALLADSAERIFHDCGFFRDRDGRQGVTTGNSQTSLDLRIAGGTPALQNRITKD